jgi:hypothetical protein
MHCVPRCILVVALLLVAVPPAFAAPPAHSAAPAAAAHSAEPFSPQVLAEARALRDRALTDDVGYEMLRSLTTEIGPRMTGSANDPRAVSWALAYLQRLGFANVHAESVKVGHWIRGQASAEIVSPWPQPMVCVALGGSGATPDGGIEAEVVPITTVTELATTPDDVVRGKIVYYGQRMMRTHDGAGYSEAVTVRGRGALEASRKGALAVLIRSIGTDNNRTPHTGGMRTADSVKTIPALALSNPDADLLENTLATGKPVRVRLRNSSSWADSTRSANVIGEIPGHARAGEIVLLGAHLDSWDLGTGAHDDGAGVATVSAAAKLIGESKLKPARTVRVVLFVNEEFGGRGSRGYVNRHGGEVAKHVMAFESDLGAFGIWGVASRVPLEKLPVARVMADLVAPLGTRFSGNEAEGGADVGPLGELGVPLMDVQNEAGPYFDIHHTANDTFDKIDPQLLRVNIAAYGTLAYLAAQYDGDFGRAIKPKSTR